MEKEILEEEKKPETVDIEEVKKEKSYGNNGEIHTVLTIKNGTLDRAELTELTKKNYFYRAFSRVDGVALINYDMTSLVPLTKDILNRQGSFLEIKMLWFVLSILLLNFIAVIIIAFIVPHGEPPVFDGAKAEILGEIRKSFVETRKAIGEIGTGENGISPPPSEDVGTLPINENPYKLPTPTPSTNDTGIAPIFPENVTPNRKINRQQNAD